MRKASFILAACGATLALAGCDVEKTQEGNVTAPKYEVTKKQEGDVTLPKYDVDAPKVDVTTTQKQVTVPDVDVNAKKETITVPKVDISRADDDKDKASNN